jgi:serine/threonine-protein kinase
MKRCPECRRDYVDDSLLYCLEDGAALIQGSVPSPDEPQTAVLSQNGAAELSYSLGDQKTEILRNTFDSFSAAANSIAVLPFANISADTDNEYFCDGLAEELLFALAKIDDLKVSARTSAFSFKGKNVNVAEIGKILNVRTVLEGSVRKEGPRVRITVQLINSADGYQIWSERYDREMNSLFEVQDEITLAVVDALKLKLLGTEKDAVLKRYTKKTEAYELYLKGRFHYQKYTPEDWLKAAAFFEEAIALEPEYALAYANLASVLAYCWYFNVLPPAETGAKWLAASIRVLELDGDLDEAHNSMARYHFYFERNWPAAEREFQKALELNSSNAENWQQYSMLLAVLGRNDEAIHHAEKAMRLDPLSLMNNLQAGWVFLFSGQTSKVLEIDEKLLEIDPNFHGAFWQIGLIRLAEQKLEEALASFQKSFALAPSPNLISHIGATYGDLGMIDEARSAADQLIKLRDRQPVAAYYIARVFSRMGEFDEAFKWLETSLKENDGELVFLNVQIRPGEPGTLGTAIRNDDRFADILRRVGLP